MKLAAVTGRGAKKGFIDVYFLLQTYSLPELLGFYRRKYPDGNDFLVYKSLTYFEDAELESMPKMLISTDWTKVKNYIVEQVKRHFP